MVRKSGVSENSEHAKKVSSAAAAEKKLLKAEEWATKRLAVARLRADKCASVLEKATARFERRQTQVNEAEALVRSCQAARMAGPGAAAPADASDATIAVVSAAELTSDASPKPKPVDPIQGES